jgi:hypothetical protein
MRRASVDNVPWRRPDGRPLACKEKLAVLNENLAEIRQSCQDALEDAVLMGCDEAQVREVLESIVAKLEAPFARRRRAGASRG